MKSLKTATVTWITYRNFGTFLQAYALQQAIIKNGYENVILSDKRIIEQLQTPSLQSKIYGFVYSLREKFRKDYKYKLKAIKAYDDFAEKFLHIDYHWRNSDDLNQKYDTFICGSDQIWSPVIPFSDYYYLGFTDTKKIAYAPSIGSFTYPEEKVSQVKPYLQRYSALSVRESQGTEIIEKQFGLSCETVLDPTLLLEKSEWDSFTDPYNGKGYVLCYMLSFNESYWTYVRNFANSKGLPVKAFIIDQRDINYVDEALYVGPKEFLNFIKNATYFFTDSFHGSVFAIHFEKKFLTFKRFKDDASNNQNSRIVNLFNLLGLNDFFKSEEQLTSLKQLPQINFADVKQKLSVERAKSLSYLIHALEN